MLELLAPVDLQHVCVQKTRRIPNFPAKPTACSPPTVPHSPPWPWLMNRTKWDQRNPQPLVHTEAERGREREINRLQTDKGPLDTVPEQNSSVSVLSRQFEVWPRFRGNLRSTFSIESLKHWEQCRALSRFTSSCSTEDKPRSERIRN